MNSETLELVTNYAEDAIYALSIGTIIHFTIVTISLLHLKRLAISDVLKFYWCVFIVLGPLFGVVAYAILMGDMSKLRRRVSGTFDDWNRRQEVEATDSQFWECPKCASTNSNSTFVCSNCGYSLR